MKRLLQRLRQLRLRSPLFFDDAADWRESVPILVTPQPEPYGPLQRMGKGHVVKVTSPPEYTPGHRPRKGGAVVKTMPKQLRSIKEGQERPLDV